MDLQQTSRGGIVPVLLTIGANRLGQGIRNKRMYCHFLNIFFVYLYPFRNKGGVNIPAFVQVVQGFFFQTIHFPELLFPHKPPQATGISPHSPPKQAYAIYAFKPTVSPVLMSDKPLIRSFALVFDMVFDMVFNKPAFENVFFGALL